MAQTNYTPISLYYSTTASQAPSAGNLVNGELAINITDGKLYYKDNGGVVQIIAGKGGAGVAAGSNTQVQFNNSGAFGASSSFTWDGTTLAATKFSGALNGTVGATTPSTGAFTTLDASGNVTLSGGTANGVLYLNGSKVATSGSALTFDGTTLTQTVADAAYTNKWKAATGLMRLRPYADATNGALFESTNAAESSYLPLSLAASTININSDAATIWKVNASEQMRLTSTGLGIGTSSITEKLTVNGRVQCQWDAYANGGTTSYAGDATSLVTGSSAGMWAARSDSALLFAIGSAEKMRLDSSGNLGLGVTPSAWDSGYTAFDIKRGSVFQNSASNWVGLANNAYNNGTNWIYKESTVPRVFRIQNDQFEWLTAPSGTAGNAISFTQSMTLDASGNLLVGDTNNFANSRLFVSDSITTNWSGTIALRYNVSGQTNNYFKGISGTQIGLSQQARGLCIFNYDQDSNQGINFYPNAYPGISSPPEPSLTLSSSGNLGLGVTPSAYATIPVLNIGKSGTFYGDGNAYNWTAGMGQNCVPSGAAQWKAMYTGQYSALYEQISGQHAWYTTSTTQTAGNAITFTQAMTLDASGNLLVGTTTFGQPDVNGAAIGVADGAFRSHHATGTASGTIHAYFTYAGLGIGSITQNGTTAVAYNTTSDYRLKDNQQPLTGSGAFIDALKPKTWTWKADGSKGVGFIAHEVRAVSPNSVVGEKDAVDADGKPVYQAMEYGSADFIANIVAELQSLRARVAQLEKGA